MARAMRAAGLRNPEAIRVMTLILVFTDSIRPLLSPWSRVAWMLGRCVRIFFPRAVNSGDAAAGGPGQPAGQGVLAFFAFELGYHPQPFPGQVGAVEAGVGFLDPGEPGCLAAGEVPGVFPQRAAGVLEVAGVAGGDADRPAEVPDRRDGPGVAGGAPDLAADLVEGTGGPGDDVERVMATSP
jgi:hypothetical protein